VPQPHLASVDGRLSPAAEATIPITDDGLLRGDGAFEIVRLYGGRPFALGEHLYRLERSAAAIELGFDRGQLEREIEALLDEYGGPDGALRIVLTRGGRRIAICEPLPDWPPTVRVTSVGYVPSEILTGVKSISYAANMQATRLAQSRGADEAILVRPDGVVLEAPTSSVFWVGSDGALRTPNLEVGILESITRARLIAALEVEQGEYRLEELREAQEAFLASTTREVQAISAVDGRSLAEAPGPRTGAAIEALAAAIRAELG
jgi:branched-chain amino acid aminotransferase